MSDSYAWINDDCTHMYYWDHYLHQGICKITMSDLLMNVDTYVTDNTAYTMLYVRSLIEIQS